MRSLLLLMLACLIDPHVCYSDVEKEHMSMAISAAVSSPGSMAVMSSRSLARYSHRVATDHLSGHYLTCSEYSSADVSRARLVSEHSQDRVQTVFVSKSRDLVCFLVFTEAHERMASLKEDKQGVVKSVVLITPMLKLSQSLMGALHDRSVHDLDWARMELHVSFGLGSGSHIIDSVAFKEHLQRSVQHRAHSVLSEFRILSSSTVTPWERAVDMMKRQREDESPNSQLFRICGFGNLRYRSAASVLIIDELQQLSKSGAGSECLAALAAVCGDSEGALHVTIAEKPSLRNEFVAEYIQSGSSGQGRVYESVGLNGTGVLVGVSDTGVDEGSCFFDNLDGSLVERSDFASPTYDLTKRKVVQYVSFYDGIEEYASAHGTHVCGTLAGHSTESFTENNGVAPAAKIAFFDIGEDSTGGLSVPASGILEPAIAAGSHLHSMSWGFYSFDYLYYDVYVDEAVYGSPSLTVIVAAGNEGTDGGNVLSPALAKNCVSVGSSGSGRGQGISTVSSFSSRGPTFDSRFGIDVLAHGTGIRSAKSSGSNATTCARVSLSGTSTSTPAVAGAAALIQQYFEDPSFWAATCRSTYSLCSSGPLLPSGSLLKAVLLHSGQDQGNGYAYPGNEQGFGRVQLDQVLVVPGVTIEGLDLFVIDVNISAHSSEVFYVTVTSDSSPLKATICWADPPNSIVAAKQLLNDIDLTVSGPTGNLYYGNNNSAGDEFNNAEIVLVSSPSPGEYTINISASVLGANSQQLVSLVITSIGIVGTEMPTSAPSTIPTAMPTTSYPTFEPSINPTATPTSSPTLCPTIEPTTPFPTITSTASPTDHPVANTPTNRPVFTLPTPLSPAPSVSPTNAPTTQPSLQTASPTITVDNHPTHRPVFSIVSPTQAPTIQMTTSATEPPNPVPTLTPSSSPTKRDPFTAPTQRPVFVLTSSPVASSSAPIYTSTDAPAAAPSTSMPSRRPVYKSPTSRPVFVMTPPPTHPPTPSSTASPTPPSGPVIAPPTNSPANSRPTQRPVFILTPPPTLTPTIQMTVPPSIAPTHTPTQSSVGGSDRRPTRRPVLSFWAR